MSQKQRRPQPSEFPGQSRAAGRAMLFMFFLSGFAALVYQILWAKQLALIFGVTIYAASAVVTTFMAGLALGSVCFGRWVDRWKRPLVLFALLEGGVAALALLFPVIAEVVLKPIYVAFYGWFGENHYVMSLVRFTLSFLVLLVPTSLMGGTLPVLSRAYVSHAKCLGREVAGLYSANNLGAFIGCVVSGYVLLEVLGLSATLLLAAVLNVMVAVLSLCLDRRLGPEATLETRQPEAQDAAGEETSGLTRPVKVALWVFGIEGFTSLAYQMAWMRLLIFLVTTNIYGITAIVATYLVGLSLGAFLVRPWIDRARDPYRVLGIIEIGIGLTALATIPLLPWLFGLMGALSQMFRGSWHGFIIARFAVSFIVIVVPTSFMGATMPVVSRIYVGSLRRLGRKIGIIGCLDTVGSIIGAFAGGFIMIPLLGIQRAIIATALINLALAAWVFAADPVPRRRAVLRVGFLASVAALVVAPLMLLLKPPALILSARALSPSEAKVLYYNEDAESSVSVVEMYGSTGHLYVNRNAAANTSINDRPSHELIAHLPLLLHPNPKRALLIGFGIGFTSWASRVHDVDVDVVELSPGVRRANRWFADYNNNILSDPRVHLRIDDGRNYVLGTGQKYDMIQAGIIHPGISSGNASFYSTDFYRECKRILKPGGIVCQWLPLHAIPAEDFKMLIRSFQAVFPYTSVWFKHGPDFCALIGTPQPLKIDFQSIERRVNVPAIRDHLARSHVQDVYDLLDSFGFADEDVRQAVGPGRLESDDHPCIEFHAERAVKSRDRAANVRLLAMARQGVWPRVTNIPPERRDEVKGRLDKWFQATQHVIIGYYYAVLLEAYEPMGGPIHRAYEPAWQEAKRAFELAIEMNPDDENAKFRWKYYQVFNELMWGQASRYTGRLDEALWHFDKAVRIAPETHHAARAKYFYNELLKRKAR